MKMSQRELAEKAGIRFTSYVSDIENGHRRVWLDEAIAISEALGMTVSELIGEKQPRMTPPEYKAWRALCELRGMQ